MQILDQTLARMKYSTQARILAELALVRISNLEDLRGIGWADCAIASGAAGGEQRSPCELAPAGAAGARHPAAVPFHVPARKKKV